MPPITTCLWFDTEAEEAANFYVSVFPDSTVGAVARYPEGAPGRAGSVMTVEFELDGHRFVGLNGGRQVGFTVAVSFLVMCADQQEIDHYWTSLTSAGGEEGRCGWCKDRFGVSWQVLPTQLGVVLSNPDPARVARATAAMLQMTKIDLAELERAADG